MLVPPIDEFIVITMPFVFSAVTIVFSVGVEKYALYSFDITYGASKSKELKKDAARLTKLIYTQLGFILAVLSSCISCIAYTIKSPRPVIAGVGGFLLVILVLSWVIFWQRLSYKDLADGKGWPMKLALWATILISYAVTLFARYYPIPVS